MLNRAAPNYKNPHPLVITLRLSLYPDQTLEERIKKPGPERLPRNALHDSHKRLFHIRTFR